MIHGPGPTPAHGEVGRFAQASQVQPAPELHPDLEHSYPGSYLNSIIDHTGKRCTSAFVVPTTARGGHRGRLRAGEDFQYVFKGAPGAPRTWRHVTTHATTAGEVEHSRKRGATPSGETHHTA